MVITDELVTYLEALGRIRLPEESRAKAQSDLQEILQYIDTLSELDTEGIEPMSHALPLTNVMREDVVQPSAPPEEVLANVRRYVRNGSIITFHDSLRSIAKLRQILPTALEWLLDQGYKFCVFD